jgi:outer membrane protein
MTGRLMRLAMVFLTTGSLVFSPVYAQSAGAPSQEPQSQGAPPQPQSTSPSADQTAPASTAPPRSVSDAEGQDYAKGKPFFPNFISPYTPIKMPDLMLTNTPRINQLIQDGKLMLSLDDAISIALENNLNISIERFVPWIAQAALLKAKAGGIPQSGTSQQVVLGNSPSISFDPILTSGVNWSRSSIPVNNPFISGTGTATLGGLTTYNANYNFGYSQGFHTGTNISITFQNDRSSSSSSANLLNPAVQSTTVYTISQPLLNGFGILPNTRYIIEAKNSIRVAQSQFAQQVIATVAQVSNDYWELVYDIENIKVQDAAVGVSTKLYNDNKKQLEIGTMAPLDVLTAESQLATDTQNLIVAQTTRLQQEVVLLNDITKNQLDPSLSGVQIVPTTPISTPEVVENVPLPDAVKEAWEKRPEIQQADLNLKNAGIEVKVTKNALLPSLNVYGQYSATGLGGNVVNYAASGVVPDLGEPVVNASGMPPSPPLYLGAPTSVTATTVSTGGLNDALKNLINNNFPTYAAGLNFTLPIRNRSAQADSARALLDERQQVVQYRQLQNTIVVNVHNAQIALTQDRAQVAAAEKARNLAAQTLSAEQKKYQLGSSTSYNVVLRSRDLTAAQGTELRARINLIEAAVNYNQAMGRTLDVNHITVADALRGRVFHDPLIPGTPDLEGVNGNQ